MTSFKEAINSSTPVLIDFYATWCEPCKWLEPILDDISRIMEGKISIRKIDIDMHSELREEYTIMGVPVLMLFKNGNLLWRYNGFMYAPDLVKKLSEFV
ncbi:MAG TPA: thioredoxin family protein [Bacteroidia bacterium]|nr:thioredoxin family protein [Bacteroidia bacterium]HNU34707.1 thioredoxin family protein [Bacteroidia bacterium]